MFEYRELLKHNGLVVFGALLVAGAVACGGGEMEPAAESEPAAPAADAPSSGPPRVFFVAPLDQTDHPTELPLALTFGAENFQISPVPEEVTMPREAVGHYHLGVNAECLPPGTVIPSADPWIHFGDGSDGIEMMMEPGEYRFSVQIGDDEHRTLGGLCETITVRMVPGI